MQVELRRSKRTPVPAHAAGVTLEWNQQLIPARILDYSADGFGIIIAAEIVLDGIMYGKLHLPTGAIPVRLARQIVLGDRRRLGLEFPPDNAIIGLIEAWVSGIAASPAGKRSRADSKWSRSESRLPPGMSGVVAALAVSGLGLILLWSQRREAERPPQIQPLPVYSSRLNR